MHVLQQLHTRLLEACDPNLEDWDGAQLIAVAVQEAADEVEASSDPEQEANKVVQCLTDTCLREAGGKLQTRLASGILDLLPQLTQLAALSDAAASHSLPHLLQLILTAPDGLSPREAVTAIADVLALHTEGCAEAPGLPAWLLHLVSQLPALTARITRQRLACVADVLTPCIAVAAELARQLDHMAHVEAVSGEQLGGLSGSQPPGGAVRSMAEHMLARGIAAPVTEMVQGVLGSGAVTPLPTEAAEPQWDSCVTETAHETAGRGSRGGQGERGFGVMAAAACDATQRQWLRILAGCLQLLAVTGPCCCAQLQPPGAKAAVPVGLMSLVQLSSQLAAGLLPPATAAPGATDASPPAGGVSWEQLTWLAELAGAAAHQAAAGSDSDSENEDDDTNSGSDGDGTSGAGKAQATAAQGPQSQPQPEVVVASVAGAAVLLWLQLESSRPPASRLSCLQCAAQLCNGLSAFAHIHKARGPLVAALQLLHALSTACSSRPADSVAPAASQSGAAAPATAAADLAATADYLDALPALISRASSPAGPGSAGGHAAAAAAAAVLAVQVACQAVCQWQTSGLGSRELDGLLQVLRVVGVNVVHAQEDALRTAAFRALTSVLAAAPPGLRCRLLFALVNEPSPALVTLLLQRLRQEVAAAAAAAAATVAASSNSPTPGQPQQPENLAGSPLVLAVAVTQLVRAAADAWQPAAAGTSSQQLDSLLLLSLRTSQQPAAAVDAMCAALSVLRLLLLQRQARAGKWLWEAAASWHAAVADTAWLPALIAGLPPLLSSLTAQVQQLLSELQPATAAGPAAVLQPPAAAATAPVGPSAVVQLPEDLQLFTALCRLDQSLAAVSELLPH